MWTLEAAMEEYRRLRASETAEGVDLARRRGSTVLLVSGPAYDEAKARMPDDTDLIDFPADVRWMVGTYES